MIVKAKFLIMFALLICLTDLSLYAGGENDGNNNQNEEWQLPPADEVSDVGLCQAENECCLYVNVICPLTISCSGDQEITMCADQDLTEADLEGFDFDFQIGGSPGAQFTYEVTVNEYSETQQELTDNHTALRVMGFDVQIDVDGWTGPQRFFPVRDGCTASDMGTYYGFKKVAWMIEEGQGVESNGCVGDQFEPILRVDINGIQTDGNVYVGLHRIMVSLHAEYVL